MTRAGDPIDDGLADLRRRAERAGRDPAAVTVAPFGARAVLLLPSAGRDQALPDLDRFAALAGTIG
jgi:hypothetical protein